MSETKNLVVKADDEIELEASIKKWLPTAKLEPKEQDQFIEIARAFCLNPWKREIYAVAYGFGNNRKLSIITGYEVYLKRAERTGKLNGWSIRLEGVLKPVMWKKKAYNNEPPKEYPGLEEVDYGTVKAIITIHRKDRDHPVIHEVFWCEVFQQNDMWGKSGRFMLKKVAMAQGFRLAFPDEMGGMPYTADELPPHMSNDNQEIPQIEKAAGAETVQPVQQEPSKAAPMKKEPKIEPKKEKVEEATIVQPQQESKPVVEPMEDDRPDLELSSEPETKFAIFTEDLTDAEREFENMIGKEVIACKKRVLLSEMKERYKDQIEKNVRIRHIFEAREWYSNNQGSTAAYALSLKLKDSPYAFWGAQGPCEEITLKVTRDMVIEVLPF